MHILYLLHINSEGAFPYSYNLFQKYLMSFYCFVVVVETVNYFVGYKHTLSNIPSCDVETVVLFLRLYIILGDTNTHFRIYLAVLLRLYII